MLLAGAVILASLFVFPVEAQQTAPAQQQLQVVECRDLAASGNYLGPNETLINGKACRPAGTPLQVAESNPTPSNAPKETSPSPAIPLPSGPPQHSSVDESKTSPQTQATLAIKNAAETTASTPKQSQTFTWSSTKCSDGTATAWPGCQSEIVPSGSYYSESVPGLFAELLYGRTANVEVTVTKINTNFIVHVGFQVALQNGRFAVQPQDAVWIESNSSIRTTIHSTLYPDKFIQAHKDADVMKQRFKNKSTITVSGSGWNCGYLFFPYDTGASNITIVVQVGNETFRFPFAKKPNLNQWLDPDKLPITLSAPVQQASESSPPLAAPALATSASSLKVISFAVIDPQSGVHSGMPEWTQNWVRKNAKNYPNVQFQNRPISGAQNYIIVLSVSAKAVSGFDPVVRTNTSTDTTPVSGSGTVTDNYGSSWNYTYDGQVTTTTTSTMQTNVPYTIESNTLYATAYDEHGVMISQRWHVYSTKQGGDAGNAIGYNLASAMFAINAKGHLMNEVVKDIEGRKRK